MKTVEIKIKNGKVKTDFKGFNGKECDNIEDKILPKQKKVLQRENKPEYEIDEWNTNSEELNENTW